ncbi:hypothetical protein Arno18_93 [Pectobacterium phage Arno18]|uniref:Uncharacterized protein n=1 Tax=Pectobacterium phage Arno18 TaxID=2500578 RepID=A0A678ZNB2_9CAUD|nr:hypothetical protein Arno18_93 [Pectobacterium phage Arno18]
MAEGASFRVYQLAVGEEDKDITSTEHNKGSTMFYVDKLQFTAHIRYSTEKTDVSSDETTFEIYNLTRDSASKFKREGATIMLRAGYDTHFKRDTSGEIIPDYNSLPVIYMGKILWATTVKKGVDKVTKIVCSSDSAERDVLKVSLGYAPKTKRATIIKDLAARMGFATLEMDLTGLGDSSYATGLSIYGSVSAALNRICEENGLMWFTYNQQIRIVPVDPKVTNLAWEVWPFQIIDSVEGYYRRQQSAKKPPKNPTNSQGKPKTPKDPKREDQTRTTVKNTDGSKLVTTITTGVKFKTFLDGRFKLGDNVVIRGSDEYLEQISDAKGQFRIISLSHDLDYLGGSWTTEIEAISASGGS